MMHLIEDAVEAWPLADEELNRRAEDFAWSDLIGRVPDLHQKWKSEDIDYLIQDAKNFFIENVISELDARANGVSIAALKIHGLSPLRAWPVDVTTPARGMFNAVARNWSPSVMESETARFEILSAKIDEAVEKSPMSQQSMKQLAAQFSWQDMQLNFPECLISDNKLNLQLALGRSRRFFMNMVKEHVGKLYMKEHLGVTATANDGW